MQITPRDVLLQFGHVLQQDLFPHLTTALGPLTPDLELVAAVVSMAPLARWIEARRAPTGRPARDRIALATAFIAKAVLNIPTTRNLRERLRVDDALRRLCGWPTSKLPHESKFSRAFAEFAKGQLPQQLHAAVVENTQSQRLIGHIARDSTAITARERPSKDLLQQKRIAKQTRVAAKRKKAKNRRKPHQRAKAAHRGPRIQRQPHQSLEVMLADLPQQCDLAAKTTKNGEDQYWRGYKLHLDVADGQVPISAVLTSASVHDSQVAIPLMTITSRRVVYLYELMDSAYDASGIHEHSRRLNHVPIIAPNGRRATRRVSPLTKIFPPKPTPELSWAEQDRFKTRTMVERVNGRLKDEFGASYVRVRGAAKVMAHLMFGVLALTVDQWMRMGKPS